MTARAARKSRKPASARASCIPLTVLDAFCRRNGITTAALAAAANVARSHTARIRAGKVPYVSLDTAKLLALGASRLVRRRVAVGELFNLDVDYRPPAPRRRGAA